MTIVKTNPITGYQLTLMPGDPEPFGWIQLVNGSVDAGYVYLEPTAGVPHLGSTGYIVTSVPLAMLGTMLDILRREKNLQIRYHDTQSGRPPSVFIEATSPSLAPQPRIPADADILAEIDNRMK